MWVCDKCGLTIHKRVVLPVHHQCGDTFTLHEALSPKACTHRGDKVGRASCGCGDVYACVKFGGICSSRPPVDEWATVTIDGVKKEIRDLNYHCCAECAEFTTAIEPPTTQPARPSPRQ